MMANNYFMDGAKAPHAQQSFDMQEPPERQVDLENEAMGHSYSALNSGHLFSPNAFQLDLNQRHPRIPVTPSMLYSYAHMRGNNVIKADPLHSTLYIHPNRVFCNRRIHLELVSKRYSIQELPKSAMLFWDPIEEPEDRQQPRPQPLRLIGNPARQTTYAEHIRENPPTVGRHHYKGDMTCANFGYVMLNNRWVDPDSEGAVADAINNLQYYSNEEPDVPHFEHIHDPGPRIMMAEEEDKFYEGYVEDVTDEQDGEGDPRQYRISPATFVQWAEGATLGERYHEKSYVPSRKLPPPNPAYEEYIMPKPRPETQFDMETGSILSGIYETDPDPRVLHNAQGVNVVRPPAAYTYSYPQSSIEIDRQAFGNEETMGYSRYSPIASTPEVYNSESGIQNLAPNDPETGEIIFDITKEYIETLRVETEHRTRSLFHTADVARASAETRLNIAKDVFFLKDHISRLPKPTHQNSQLYGPASPIPTPPSPNITHPQPASPSGFTPPPQRRLRKQYRRYLDEELDRAETAVVKTTQFEKRLDDEHQEILDEIEELKVLREALLGALGVHSTDQIPGLVPTREKPGRDLRTQFGLVDGEENGMGEPYE